MTWNYRLVKVKDRIAVHEVYYDGKSKPESMTLIPETLISCAEDDEDPYLDVVKTLEMILRDLKYDPRVLEYPKDFLICHKHSSTEETNGMMVLDMLMKEGQTPKAVVIANLESLSTNIRKVLRHHQIDEKK